MTYDLTDTLGAKKAAEYLVHLVERKALVKITKVSPKRSLNQNAYLHLIIGAFGVHFGYTLEEAKLVYKEINASIYRYKKRGRTFYRSSSDLTKDEMAKSIDTFRTASAEQGCELPEATDQEWLRWISNEVEQADRFIN